MERERRGVIREPRAATRSPGRPARLSSGGHRITRSSLPAGQGGSVVLHDLGDLSVLATQ